MRIKSEREAADYCGDDDPHRRDAEEIYQAHCGDGEDGCFPVYLGVDKHLDGRREDERHHAWTDAAEDALNHLIFLVFQKKYRDDEDYHYRGNDGAEACCYCAPYSFDFVAGVERGVDGEDARKHLHYRYHVPELVLLDPMATVNDGTFDHVEHGIAATEGESPDVEEGDEELPDGFHKGFYLLMISKISDGVTTIGDFGKCFKFPVTTKEPSFESATS